VPLSETFLGHMGRTREDFSAARSHEEFRSLWSDFLRPCDVLVVYHQSTANLLAHIDAALPPRIILKSIQLDRDRSYGTLEDFLSGEGIDGAQFEQAKHHGRAEQRLAMAIAMVRHLNHIRNREMESLSSHRTLGKLKRC